MNILVTGGAGYAGSEICAHLLREGHRVTAVDNLSKGSAGIQGAAPYREEGYSDFKLVEADILEWSPTEVYDAIIHLAALVGDKDCNRDRDLAYRTNCVGTMRALDWCGSNTKFIMFSTSAIYGPVDAMADEDTAMNPQTHYAETKATADGNVQCAGGTVLRLNHLYGWSRSGRLPEIVNEFADMAMRQGRINLYHPRAWRAVCAIEDACNAVTYALHSEHLAGRAWNVVGQNMQKIHICEDLFKVFPDTDLRLYQAPKVNPNNNMVDGSRFRLTTGFSPKTSVLDAFADIKKRSRF